MEKEVEATTGFQVQSSIVYLLLVSRKWRTESP